jgi:TonB family protein
MMLGAALALSSILQATGAADRQQPAPRSSTPQGQRIDARDGDTIVIDDDARVRVVRRRPAHVRAVFNSKAHWLIVLARYTPQDGRPVRDGVDETYIFREIVGTWPLGERWEGDGTIETYSLAGGTGAPAGFGLRSPSALAQLFARDPLPFRDSTAEAVLSYRGSSRTTVNGASFDDTERIGIADAVSNSRGGGGNAVTAGVTGGVSFGADASSGGVALAPQTGAARKVHDVRPVWPEAARQARIQGVVIVELNIGADGSVTDARVLRGIPQLDEAALECVRQWRYEPTFLNGRAVPVTITAAVPFP